MGIFGKKRIDDDNDNGNRTNIANNMSDLQKKIERQNELLREGTSKLEAVRSEYDTVVHDLMTIKKEINEQSQERVRLERINLGLRDEISQGKQVLKQKSKDLESAKTINDDLARSTEKLERTKKEYASIKARLDRMQLDNNTDMLQCKENLEISQSECQDLRGRMREQHEVIIKLQEHLERARRRSMASTPKNNPEKGVVEAASAMVASFRKQMIDAQNALAEEKTRHAQTLKRLEELEG
ncbi:MAG: hypothetical protein F4W68_00985 [Cenarchaeum sp. SB0661_bin_35]|nr:hypothetical protein [Cenarchaeum sp. SB0667_bin_13]MXZ93121.1 hypothetical protein [Cenarchaeum sp. SB0666_bin_15]MYB47505.1 hypothetical protein [Cenarchaeum sp. SB0662_bin_33]MYC79070.1 hypothetical protein [Cenarchaeum sp. SB0661_bin_35]MYD58589.1 hypothetical protein [Cenarchaeum sp. SB0678_bin_8]MYI51628.1 hypothetical protein [Cenarchaeum sp. SB0673_bin_9]MYJ27726.1 hypothetical protein [Cenarchaeum sp. SB0672_bin_9]